MKGGLPIIAVRDLAIHKRADDLVLATFGRGFYVLDDVSPLRRISAAMAESAAVLLPSPKALMYVPSTPMGGTGKGDKGDGFYVAPNPPKGAVFTYYFKDGFKSLKDRRLEAEAEVEKKGGDIYYPSWDSLAAEDREEEPTVWLTVRDFDGQVVRRIKAASDAGLHRTSWDLTYPAPNPTSLEEPKPSSGDDDQGPIGPRVAPGTYSVALSKRVQGVETALAGPLAFECVPLGLATLPAKDPVAVLAFQRKSARLQRAVLGAQRVLGEAQQRVAHLKRALEDTPGVDPKLRDQARTLEAHLREVDDALNGDRTRSRRSEPTPPSLADRINTTIYGQWTSTTEPTATQRRGYDIAAEEFGPVLAKLRGLIESDLAQLEAAAEQSGAPWTPGRVPQWKPE
jgi:hypothetical protein